MDDWPILIRNAVTIIVILVAISVVLLLLYLGLNAANAGAERLANTTATLDSRSFTAYDQQQMRGTVVLNAIQQFAGHPVGVVVVTNRGSSDGQAALYNAAFAEDLDGAEALHDIAGDLSAWFEFDVEGSLLPNDGIVGQAPNVQRLILRDDLGVFPDVQNQNTAPTIHTASPHYINRNALFESVLIFDVNDSIVGIYLEQVSGTPVAGNARILRD